MKSNIKFDFPNDINMVMEFINSLNNFGYDYEFHHEKRTREVNTIIDEYYHVDTKIVNTEIVVVTVFNITEDQQIELTYSFL